MGPIALVTSKESAHACYWVFRTMQEGSNGLPLDAHQNLMYHCKPFLQKSFKSQQLLARSPQHTCNFAACRYKSLDFSKGVFSTIERIKTCVKEISQLSAHQSQHSGCGISLLSAMSCRHQLLICSSLTAQSLSADLGQQELEDQVPEPQHSICGHTPASKPFTPDQQGYAQGLCFLFCRSWATRA